ncbi:OprD family outer membrane porin [Flectobacillus major]|uniref:OprD family outer membrane porin n=1 Tax=Flectobacillus major TaxID=103 RepID=UPI0005C6A2C0|nr:OprD family outer membrane porin [Flectobacillus major]
MLLRKLLFLFLINVSLVGLAQQGIHSVKQDTNTFTEALLKGKISGQARLMSISTDNQNELSDYWATAFGLGLGYRSALYKGFQLNVQILTNQNISSPDFTKPDPTTQNPNRYEMGLFDMANASRKNLIFRIQELYLKYQWKKSAIWLGNYTPKNSFINAQDSRMSPTLVQGLALDLQPNTQWQIKIDGIWRVSPRSTTHWYTVGQSIGVYPVGVNPDGSKSQYAHNTSSAGIGMIDIYYKPNKNLTLLLGNILAENIFNTAYCRTEYTWHLAHQQKLLLGGLAVHQNSVGNGGNTDITKSYFPNNNRSWILNTRIGYWTNNWESSLNFGRTTADGRYLMPREWGVEQFYTVLPRERNEGAGDVWSYSMRLGKSFQNKNLKTELGYGYYRFPNIKNTQLNKYGFADYTHFMASINYNFKGIFKGLNTQILFIRKDSQGNTYNNQRYIINKVNMSQWNFIANYTW